MILSQKTGAEKPRLFFAPQKKTVLIDKAQHKVLHDNEQPAWKSCNLIRTGLSHNQFLIIRKKVKKITVEKRKNIIDPGMREARLAEKPPATKQDLSARLAVLDMIPSAGSIEKIENGTRPVTDIPMPGFAKALKVTVFCLMSEE